MSDKDILSEMIHDSALVPLEYEYDKPTIKLDEPDVQDSVARIRNAPGDAIVIKGDAFAAPTSFFKCSKGECKRADFIIICPEKKIILYIELKAGPKDAAHIVKQLKGTACLVAYCKDIGKSFWNQDGFLEGYSHRFIGMVNLSINTRPSRHPRTLIHDTPETFLKLSSTKNLQFAKLVGVQ